jgi:hypothetical protein
MNCPYVGETCPERPGLLMMGCCLIKGSQWLELKKSQMKCPKCGSKLDEHGCCPSCKICVL